VRIKQKIACSEQMEKRELSRILCILKLFECAGFMWEVVATSLTLHEAHPRNIFHGAHSKNVAMNKSSVGNNSRYEVTRFETTPKSVWFMNVSESAGWPIILVLKKALKACNLPTFYHAGYPFYNLISYELSYNLICFISIFKSFIESVSRKCRTGEKWAL